MHVGISDDFHDSIELAAAELDRPLNGPAYAPGEVFIAGVQRLRVMTFSRMPKKADESPIVEVAVPAFPLASVEELKAMLGKVEAEEKQLAEVANAMVKVRASGREGGRLD